MGETDIVIRRVRAADIPALLELWRQARLSIRPQGRDAPEALRRQVAVMGRHFWLAEHQGKVVGTVLGTHDSRKGWINRLAVHPDYRRSGLAATLLERVERSLAEEGLEIFAAMVEEDNQTSREFFEKLNYELFPVYYFRKRLREGI